MSNNNSWITPVVVGAITGAAGFGIGYILGKKRAPEKEVIRFRVLTNEEQEPMQIDYNIPFDFNQQVEVMETVIETEGYDKSNVFDNPNETGWDWEAELSARRPEFPYILHVTEYMESEMGYTQKTYTYYNEDDILADENEVKVLRPDKVIGRDLRFGHGTSDPSVVYIRNEKLETEYEVCLFHGSYAREVEGLEIEEEMTRGDLKHSALRMRRE